MPSRRDALFLLAASYVLPRGKRGVKVCLGVCYIMCMAVKK